MNYARKPIKHSFTSVNETTVIYCEIILVVLSKTNEPVCLMLLLHKILLVVVTFARLQGKTSNMNEDAGS